MVPFVHMPAVIAGRGCAGFLPAVFYNAAARALGFDDMVAAMPEILRETFDEICRAHAAAGKSLPADFDKETIVLVGWSPWRQTMTAHEFVQHDRATGFAARSIGPAYFSPWIDGMQAPPFADPFDRAAMKELAEMQVQAIEERAPGSAAGGRYIVAELNRQGMSIETICDLQRQGARL